MGTCIGVCAHPVGLEGNRRIAGAGSRRHREGTGRRRRRAGSRRARLRTAAGRRREDKLRQKPEGSRSEMGNLLRHLQEDVISADYARKKWHITVSAVQLSSCTNSPAHRRAFGQLQSRACRLSAACNRSACSWWGRRRRTTVAARSLRV